VDEDSRSTTYHAVLRQKGGHMASETLRMIFTHEDPDQDACSSVWAVRRYVPGFSNAPVMTKPANWVPDEATKKHLIEGTYIAVDMEIDGLGIKGEKEDGIIQSGFAAIIRKYRDSIDSKVLEVLKPMMTYMDAEDANPSGTHYLLEQQGVDKSLRRIFHATGFNMAFSALRGFFGKDFNELIKRVSDLLDGYVGWMLQESEVNVSGLRALVKSHLTSYSNDKFKQSLLRFVKKAVNGDSPTRFLLANSQVDEETLRVIESQDLQMIFNALHYTYCETPLEIDVMMRVIIDGYILEQSLRDEAYRIAGGIELIEGKVAVIKGVSNPYVAGALFGRGAYFVIFEDGYNRGVLRSKKIDVRADHDYFREVVEEAGEDVAEIGTSNGEKEWFAHEDGRLFCTGTRKAPCNWQTDVVTRHLMHAALMICEEIDQN
jgi:hypothetical protein